jgi:hypothetical protein
VADPADRANLKWFYLALSAGCFFASAAFPPLLLAFAYFYGLYVCAVRAQAGKK